MTLENNWQHKTIENLEKKNFGELNNAPTNMVKRCLELCRLPLDNFTVGDLRLMIGQQFGLPYLIPLALEHVSKDIFIEGDFFQGDLLKNVLAIDKVFWKDNKHLWTQLNELIKDKRGELVSKQISTTFFETVF